MSRIDYLIAKHCPDGVEFDELGNVAAYSSTRIDASDLDETTFVGVDNLLPDMAGKTNATYTANTARLTAYEIGDILLGNIRPYLKKIWLASNSGGCSGDVLTIRIAEPHRPELMPDFLYRLLASDDFFAYNMQHAKGAKMPRGSKEAILRYRIPIPPLEVQREIVKVLDTFTQLEAELEAELEARRRQYQYYRNVLLTFGERTDTDASKQARIRWATLGELTKPITNIRWQEVSDKEFRYIDLTSVDRETHAISDAQIISRGSAPSRAQQIVREGDIIFGTTRPMLKRYTIVPTEYDGNICSTGYCVLRLDTKHLLPNFVFHILGTAPFYAHVEANERGASYPAISDSDVKAFRIPVPPLEEQERIVTILDKFDALVNDISIGLPAELKARRQQYEHYRDRLLTFREAS